MQRVFFKMRCLPGKQEEYVRRHHLLMHFKDAEGISEEERQLLKSTWELHKAAGIQNYSIFLIGCDLFAYFEAEDYRKSLEQVTASPDGQAWQKYMDGFLQQENGVPVMQMCEQSVFYME
jgi:L-rhamnose mutarotase